VLISLTLVLFHKNNHPGLNPDDDEEDEGYTTSTVAIASAGFLLLGVIIGGLLHMCWVGKPGSNISNDDRQGAVRL